MNFSTDLGRELGDFGFGWKCSLESALGGEVCRGSFVGGDLLANVVWSAAPASLFT